MMSLADLKPYEKNPRKNDKAVEPVANSIRDFGFKVPLVIDKDNIIVCGHTRYKAAQKLGMKEVPCIKADDLTPEQIKAFRLADNKVAEIAEWDFSFLDEELAGIGDAFDMESFGFLDADDGGTEQTDYFERSQKMRTDNAYNLQDYDATRVTGDYDMPIVKALHEGPQGEFLGFKDIPATSRRDMIIHFYMDDYRFERMWDQPQVYMDKLAEFYAVVSTDFSIYTDMPRAMQIWNTYRNRLLSQMMQDRGIIVVPSLNWGHEKTYNFTFDGLEPGGIYCTSTRSCIRDEENAEIWRKGMDEAIKRLKPEGLIVYGKMPEYDFKGIKTKNVAARSFYTEKEKN